MATTLSSATNTVPSTVQPAVFLSRFDEFFGSTARPPPAVTSSASRGAVEQPPAVVAPPAYGTPDFPAPAYEQTEEPTTLAKQLFRYGFYFPLFWLMGTFILFSKLSPTPEEECGKSAEAQAEEIKILRQAELKYAKRCALALFSLLFVIGMIILGCYLGHVGAFKRHTNNVVGLPVDN